MHPMNLHINKEFYMHLIFIITEKRVFVKRRKRKLCKRFCTEKHIVRSVFIKEIASAVTRCKQFFSAAREFFQNLNAYIFAIFSRNSGGKPAGSAADDGNIYIFFHITERYQGR